MSKFRDVSPAEFTYLGRDTSIESPFVNQFIVEGHGQVSKETLEQAVVEAAAYNPGICLQLKGRWMGRYWAKDERLPEILEYQGSWNGNSSLDADAINGVLNARTDVLSSITFFRDHNTEQFKLLFRIHHGICDGAGTLHWIREIFRALRKEELQGSIAKFSELDMINREDYPEADNLIANSKPVFPVSQDPDASGCHWIKYRWPVGDTKLLAKLIFVIKELTEEEHGEGIKSTFRIPSDLRRYLSREEKKQNHLSNMSGVFDLSFEQKMSVDDIHKAVIKAMRAKKDLSVYPKKLTRFTKLLPKSVFMPNPQFLRNMHERGECSITGMISYVGKVNLEDFSCVSFQAEGVYAIPMPLEDKSIYVGLFTDEQGALAVLSVPNALSDIPSTEAMAQVIGKKLKSLE